MEIALRSALIAWLAADPVLFVIVNAITEEAPARTSYPWIAIVASASTDWSTKTAVGREVRIAIELHCRGDSPDTAADILAAIERAVAALPPQQTGFAIVTTQFLRARSEQRAANVRAILLEYRFRLLAA